MLKQMMSEDELMNAYEDYLDPDYQIKPRTVETCECGGLMAKDQFFLFCKSCGVMDLDSCAFVVDVGTGVGMTRATLYKRRVYCLEKLRLMTGHKQCRSKEYPKMIRFLKMKQFKTLPQLRVLMKQYGYHKFYKYIYNIYHDIKKKRLITLTATQINCITTQFVDLEWKFKQSDTKRHNMICYHTVIRHLMSRNKIPGSRFVPVPNNHKALIKIVKQLHRIKLD